MIGCRTFASAPQPLSGDHWLFPARAPLVCPPHLPYGGLPAPAPEPDPPAHALGAGLGDGTWLSPYPSRSPPRPFRRWGSPLLGARDGPLQHSASPGLWGCCHDPGRGGRPHTPHTHTHTPQVSVPAQPSCGLPDRCLAHVAGTTSDPQRCDRGTLFGTSLSNAVTGVNELGRCPTRSE